MRLHRFCVCIRVWGARLRGEEGRGARGTGRGGCALEVAATAGKLRFADEVRALGAWRHVIRRGDRRSPDGKELHSC